MKPSDAVRFIAGLGDSLDQVIGTLLLVAVAIGVLVQVALKVLGKAEGLCGDRGDGETDADAGATDLSADEEEMHDLQRRLRREREEEADRREREDQDRRAYERSLVDDM